MGSEDEACKKGLPILCMVCKSGREGDERLYMFGGNRPFMAKFESKLIAFIGHERFSTLCEKYKTKFNRSYICKHCYRSVNNTYDSIIKIQQGVAKSVKKVMLARGCALNVEDSDCEDEEMIHQPPAPRKKLPPVVERIAEKIASLTFVRINNKEPCIILKPVTLDSKCKSNSDESEPIQQNEKASFDTSTIPCELNKDVACMVSNREPHLTDQDQDDNTRLRDSTLDIQVTNCPNSSNANSSSGSIVGFHHEHDSEAAAGENVMCLPSVSSEHLKISGHDDKSCIKRLSPNYCIKDHNQGGKLSVDEETHSEKFDCLNSETQQSRQPSAEDLMEILANPSLLVKSPQPIKLADVKNCNVYICGEGSCDWIFSSKYFWENHIRHYHYYGKPLKCPFKGCNRYFSTRSKQGLHIRTHTDERPFVCEKCGKAFRGTQELKHHKGTHTVGKPFRCPRLGCEQAYKYRNTLMRHLQHHDGYSPFPCDYPKCGKAFKNKYELKCHYRLHTGEKPYICKEPGCSKSFRLPCEYTKHRRQHSGEKPFKCSIEGCSAAYITCGGLSGHMLTHSTQNNYCCEHCGKTFKYKMSYVLHHKQHTSHGDFKCDVEGCGKAFHLKYLLLSHMTSVHDVKQPREIKRRARKSTDKNHQVYLCPMAGCGKEYVDSKSMDQHMVSKHNIHDFKPQPVQRKKFYTCTVDGCGSRYITYGGLRYHKLTAHNAGSSQGIENQDTTACRKLPCPSNTCEKKYDDTNGLRDHMAKAHTSMPRERMCGLCGWAFPHIQQLENHVESFHSEISVLNEHSKGIYICKAEQCGIQFHNAEELRCHVAWHLVNPIYCCEFEGCQRTFLLEKSYDGHVMEHQNLKPYLCDFQDCTETFSSQLKLLRHSRAHYGNFKCPIDGCGKLLHALNSARIHMFRHTGEKPYACTVCGMKFAASAQWIRHKRTHTGEKPYECTVCQTRFADTGILRTHMRSHTGEKPFTCKICGCKFPTDAALRSHIRIHTGELPFVCTEEGCSKAFRDSSQLRSHLTVHAKPSHLCSQCGKVYKFNINKHRCKAEDIAKSVIDKMECVQSIDQPLSQPLHEETQLLTLGAAIPPPLPSIPPLSLPPPPSSSVSQPSSSMLPPPSTQYNMDSSSIVMMPEQGPGPSYVSDMDAAADYSLKGDYPSSHETVLMQDADRNLMISSPYYNYMILYDRPVHQ